MDTTEEVPQGPPVILPRVTNTMNEQQLYVKQLEEQVHRLKHELRIKDEKDLLTQKKAKLKRAAELHIANIELMFQNGEKEKRAAELAIANIELVFQNKEKEKRAAELDIANIELVFQNREKEKRAAELGIANLELIFQNGEKERRAQELGIANIELVFQNSEKEKRAAELSIKNKELLAFTYISSHDLQEPLRKIQIFSKIILENEYAALSEHGKGHFNRIHAAALRMQTLIQDLLAYSQATLENRIFETTDLDEILKEACEDLIESIKEKKAIIRAVNLGHAYINKSQFRHLLTNLVANALKFSKAGVVPEITIVSRIGKGINLEMENKELTQGSLSATKCYCHISLADNGIGFDAIYKDKIFEVFQRLHRKEEYAGTGIGLAIVKKIIENHNGIITSSGKLGEGATFDLYFPEKEIEETTK